MKFLNPNLNKSQFKYYKKAGIFNLITSGLRNADVSNAQPKLKIEEISFNRNSKKTQSFKKKILKFDPTSVGADYPISCIFMWVEQQVSGRLDDSQNWWDLLTLSDDRITGGDRKE